MQRRVGRWRRHVTFARVTCSAGRQVAMTAMAARAMLAATGRKRYTARRQREAVVEVRTAMVMRCARWR